MKRILFATSAALFGALIVTLGTALAQGGADAGFPPQTDLYNDAVMLARLLPFVAALGIGFGIWQGKVSLRQQKSSPNWRYVIRHDFGVVIQHWVNTLGFLGGMITGATVLRWLQRPDEMRWMFATHYISAGLVVFAIASHLAQHFVTGGMGLFPRSLKDIMNGLGEVVEYSGIFGPEGAVFHLKLPKGIRDTFAETFRMFGIAPAKLWGKYHPAEKTFSYLPWAIIVTVMIVTGLIKTFRYLYPIPPTFIAQVTSIHDIFAIASIVMLVVHMAAVLLAPRNWPLVFSIVTGRVIRKHVAAIHPLWYKELVAKEQQSGLSPAAPAVLPATEQAQATAK